MTDIPEFGAPGKSIQEFFDDPHFVRVLIGGRGCIHGDTLIYDPVAGTSQTAMERKGEPFHVCSLDGQNRATSHRVPEGTFLQGCEKLFSVLTNGIAFPIRVAGQHRFLTKTGWKALRALKAGDLIAHYGEAAEAVEWAAIARIEHDDTASDFYDLEVPGAGNYMAEGLWHHNCGKTRALAEDITAHIFQNAGAKAIVARQTEASQEDSSIDTFFAYFETLGPLYQASDIGMFKSWNNGRSFRLPSKLAIDELQKARVSMKSPADFAAWMKTTGDRLCGYIEFRGLPDAEKGKFRGMECSYLALVEADQIVRRQFELCFACLRWKGTDPETCDEKGYIRDRCIVLDTNPPSESHWIAQLEKEELSKLPSQQQIRFWHISTYENEHNLPEHYIRDQILLPYAKNSAMIDRMLYGKYADACDGQAVFYAYSREAHEREGLGWPKGASMVVGMDVGTYNASIISAFKVHKGEMFFWTLMEIILRDSDTDRQCVELLKTLALKFPYWNSHSETCPECFFFCDPAARNSSYTMRGPTSSALKVIQSHGIFPGMMTGVQLQPSIATCNRLMQINHVVKDSTGEERVVWNFQIDPKRCPDLVSGMRAKYRYPVKGEPGYDSDKPLKGTLCDNVDHVVDSWRYSVINAFDLAKETHPSGMTAAYSEVVNQEPARRV